MTHNLLYLSHYNKQYIKIIALAFILLAYFLYVSYEFDIKTGGMSSVLLWSFFVLCTPIADAGFLLDFPIRLLFNIKMLFTEVIVWLVAIIVNLLCFNFASYYYSKTAVTKLFYLILSNPYPYWSIILLSFIGTFLSIKFGDDIWDNFNNHNSNNKSKFIIMSILIGLAVFLYYHLLKEFNFNI